MLNKSELRGLIAHACDGRKVTKVPALKPRQGRVVATMTMRDPEHGVSYTHDIRGEKVRKTHYDGARRQGWIWDCAAPAGQQRIMVRA